MLVSFFTRPGPGRVERRPQDPLAPAAGEHAGLDGHLGGRVGVQVAADRGVFALGVLAVHQHVDAAGGLAGERARHPGEQVRRADVDVLVELPPHRQQQFVNRDAVRHPGRVADRAEQDGVERGQRVPPVRRQHPAGLEVKIGTPRQLGERQLGAVEPGGGRRDRDGVPGDFGADAVAAEDGDPGGCHCGRFRGGVWEGRPGDRHSRRRRAGRPGGMPVSARRRPPAAGYRVHD